MRRICSGSSIGLILTGLWMFFFYTPAGGFGLQSAVVAIHWIFTISLMASLLVVAVTHIRDNQIVATLMLACSAILSIAAALIGPFLAWRQLALFEISTGEDIRGFDLFFTDQIVFAVVGGDGIGPFTAGIDGEVLEPTTLRLLLVVHIVLLPLAYGLAALTLRFASRVLQQRPSQRLEDQSQLR